MNHRVPEKVKIDPSDTRQKFKEINIKLLCCRYWILNEWDCLDLSVPFWRIYYNSIEGAKIRFQNQLVLLNKRTLVIIPPNTAFAGFLSDEDSPKTSENIAGRQFTETDDIGSIGANSKVDHLFMHFTLGFPMDYAKPGIYALKKNAEQNMLVEQIIQTCIQRNHFSFFDCLKINALISSCVLQLESILPEAYPIDQRISSVMKFIEHNKNRSLSNQEFASMVNMAPNSFARLFKNCTGVTIQQYVAKKKIENALDLIHHSNKNIDEIAYECGFADRFHFSKCFKKNMHVNPSYYKKNLTFI
ncbi:helix-turn-helix domain-containing protein [Sphingobacterium paludis]|uniref:AraC-like DNA-binding protein n=1 Tax=Sphingobacterium paludis TaxID=1476465 RepID=A0A4V3E0U9_9SPHI|nr:AraC family transcriptional regulator [Sphingobacterium paludis]TDS06800.1 AraC-like DNA-binding protein [Sphingobacterium paludis]